jgi:hypothetical protein
MKKPAKYLLTRRRPIRFTRSNSHNNIHPLDFRISRDIFNRVASNKYKNQYRLLLTVGPSIQKSPKKFRATLPLTN